MVDSRIKEIEDKNTKYLLVDMEKDLSNLRQEVESLKKKLDRVYGICLFFINAIILLVAAIYYDWI